MEIELKFVLCFVLLDKTIDDNFQFGKIANFLFNAG